MQQTSTFCWPCRTRTSRLPFHWNFSQHFVGLEIEDRHRIVPAVGDESPAGLRRDRHPAGRGAVIGHFAQQLSGRRVDGLRPGVSRHVQNFSSGIERYMFPPPFVSDAADLEGLRHIIFARLGRRPRFAGLHFRRLHNCHPGRHIHFRHHAFFTEAGIGDHGFPFRLDGVGEGRGFAIQCDDRLLIDREGHRLLVQLQRKHPSLGIDRFNRPLARLLRRQRCRQARRHDRASRHKKFH